MSSAATTESRSPVTNRDGSGSQIALLRTKITRGCHLKTPAKNCPDEGISHSICPIQGVQILSTENGIYYNGPNNTPRSPQKVEITDDNLATQESSQDRSLEENISNLSVVGAKFSSLSQTPATSKPFLPPSNLQSKPDLPVLINSPCLHQHAYPSCDESLDNGPGVPPPTPSECSFASFKVDGQRLSNISGAKFPMAKDFNPGYVKRASYCCGKCQERMLGHEALMVESLSPIQNYRKTKSSQSMYYDRQGESLHDHFANFFDEQISENTIEELRQQRIRLWCHKDKFGPRMSENPISLDAELEEAKERFLNRENILPINCPDSVSKEEETEKIPTENNSCVFCNESQTKTSESVLEQHDQTKEAEPQESSKENNVEVKDKEVPKESPVRFRSKSAPISPPIFNPVLPSLSPVDQGSDLGLDDNDKDGNAHEITININSTSKGSATEGDKNYNTCDETVKTQQDASQQQFGRERIEEVLRECADIMDIPKGGSFLPDINKAPQKDLCFKPMIDKRYNKWKRRRRLKKSKLDEMRKTPIPTSDSSSEESQILVPRNTPSPRIRRRKRTQDDDENTACTFRDEGYNLTSSYDADAELTCQETMAHPEGLGKPQSQLEMKREPPVDENRGRLDVKDAPNEHASNKQIMTELSNIIPNKRHGLSSTSLSLLQSTSIPLTRKELPKHDYTRTKNEQTMRSLKLPAFPVKSVPIAPKQDRAKDPKYIQRSLPFYDKKNAECPVLKYNQMGRTERPLAQYSGMVNIRMDRSIKERLLISRFSKNKTSSSSPNINIKPAATDGVTIGNLLQTLGGPPLLDLEKSDAKQTTAKKANTTTASKEPEPVGDVTTETIDLKSNETGTKNGGKKAKIKKVFSGLDRRKCISVNPKKTLLDVRKTDLITKKNLRESLTEKIQPITANSFTNAFTYSFFDLPEIYKSWNDGLKQRAGQVWTPAISVKA